MEIGAILAAKDTYVFNFPSVGTSIISNMSNDGRLQITGVFGRLDNISTAYIPLQRKPFRVGASCWSRPQT